MEQMENELTKQIYLQYPSIRAFAKACGVPHGTIVSALNNGIEGMAYGKVKKMCNCLGIDMNSFELLENISLDEQLRNRVFAYYSRLGKDKQEKVIEYIKDIM